MIGSRSAANLVLLCAGLVIWSSAFVSLYGALSIGCAFGWESIALGPISLQRGVLIGLWLVHILMIAALLPWAWSRLRRSRDGEQLEGFFARTVWAASVVALAVTVINYAPVVSLSACL